MTLLSKIVARLDDLRAKVPHFPWTTHSRSLEHARQELKAARAMAKAPSAPSAPPAAAGAPAKRSLLGLAERASAEDMAENARLVARHGEVMVRLAAAQTKQAELDAVIALRNAEIQANQATLQAKRAQLVELLEQARNVQAAAAAQVAAFGFMVDDYDTP